MAERIIRKDYTTIAPVPLTQEETIMVGAELADFEAKLAAVKEEKAAAAKKYRDDIKVIEGMISRRAKAINDGAVEKEVVCCDVLTEDGSVQTRINGTDEVVRERPASEEELQGDLFE